MTEEELYAELPADPEEAFIVLEQYFRNRCNEDIARAHENEPLNEIYVNYICKVIAAVEELGVATTLQIEDVPEVQHISYSTYVEFVKNIEHYRTKLLIRRARRNRNYSVAFDAAAKAKLKHHLDQIHDTVEKLEIAASKKEALFSKIAALQAEVDRGRTKFEVYADLVVEVAGTLGEGASKLEPIRKWLDTIGRLFWGAKQEEPPQLPAPTPRKRIEGPKADAKPKPPIDQDDDIPF